MRSSVVPQTIARDTAQNTNWKNHFDSIVASDVPTPGNVFSGSPRCVKKKPPLCPITLPAPKANAKPTAHQQIAAIEKLVRIFAITVPAFFAREKPISRNAKPACMNITSAPATITQSELTPTDMSSLPAIAWLRSWESARAEVGASSARNTAAVSGTAARLSGFLTRAQLLSWVDDQAKERPARGLCTSVENSGCADRPEV